MGIEAETKTKDSQVELDETEDVVEETVDDNDDVSESTDPDPNTVEDEDETEVEIVLEGETPPKNGPPKGVLKRFKKYKKRIEEAKAETEDVLKRNRLLEEENKILRLSASRGKESLDGNQIQEPNPEDFDEGTFDPAYKKALEEWNKEKIREEVRREIAETAKKQETDVSERKKKEQFREKGLAHYERAAKLGVKDYEKIEDTVIGILGKENVDTIIEYFDNSELLLYWLGKHPEEAEGYAEKLKENPVQAVVEFGGLLNRIKVKPKTETTPDPDEELDGATPSATEHFQVKLNKLREKARSGKQEDMKRLLAYKKELRQKKVILK